MVEQVARAKRFRVKDAFLLIGWLTAASLPALAQDPESTTHAESRCSVDLRNSGHMKDIVSNALHSGVRRPEADVRDFLTNAESKYETGQDLLRAAARHFEIDEATMAAEVERFRHVNCAHGPVADSRPTAPGDSRPADRSGGGAALEISSFARDVTLHVILHELGHALIREFDLPVLGNEETMADAFATHYLTTHLPERAVDVLKARTASLMIEAREVSRAEWPVSGEHDNDARRAFQIAALAVAADPTKYASVAKVVEMSDRDVQKARDYGAEIHRSWRRMLAPIWMPDGVRSKEARLLCDSESGLADSLKSVGLWPELESVITRFDWHSQVTVRFLAGDGRAGWSRSARTVSVPTAYVRRFIEQGRIAATQK
jgi:Putative metallopeptidase